MTAPSPTRPPTTRRLDASMSLLSEVMERPLDPGYAAAAERRRLAPDQPRRPLVNGITLIMLAVIGLLSVAAVLALRAPQPQAASAKQALLQRIRTGTASADRLQKANDQLRVSNDKDQASLLRLDARGQLADQIQLLGIVSGSLAVQGPGLRVTVNDAAGSAAGTGSDPRQQQKDAEGRVMDRDLQVVVNGLWAAGAEAISINGQRLTGLSAIRSAGQAILVDFRPLSPPYVISAVGSPDAMRPVFADGSGGRYLRSLTDNFGIDSDIDTVKSMSLPAASGVTLHEAEPITKPIPTPTVAPKATSKPHPTSSEKPS
jgi:uncharacterized protein YlxW (UPF0749 family)